MTTYKLTTGVNNITGGNGTDMFEGEGGGSDSLLGGGGNDFFNIQTGQTGLINGGVGYDRLYMAGPGFNNEFDANLQIVGVEELILDATNLFATAAQLKGFTHFGLNNSSDQFHFFLQGAGGALNFSQSYTEPQRLTIDAESVTSAMNVIGSGRSDEILGSDFNDTLSGFRGGDVLRGGAGNDIVGGGLGKDTLYGDDGKDSYLFNTAPVAANLDHLGDFRPADDTIRLDKDVFSWAGQATGALTASSFKVIGTGQTEDANDHILYNQNTGVISYDVDGAGGAAPQAFAVADNFSGDVPVLTYHDFLIVV